jgi:hypothetical protein
VTANQKCSTVAQEMLACSFDLGAPVSNAHPAFQQRTFMHAMLREPREQRRNPPLVDRELTLFDMLDDPIVICVMLRDGVARGDVLRLFAAVDRQCLCRAA